MAANPGRELVLKYGTNAIAGVQTKSLSIGAEPIDITSDDDTGWRSTLGKAGNRTVDISAEGICKDDTLRAIMFNDTTLKKTTFTLEWPDGETLAQDFFISAYEESGEYNGAIKFTCSLVSSGAPTYTP